MTVRSAEGLMLLVTFIAGAGWFFTKMALASFTPFTFIGVRFVLSAFVLALFCWRDLWRMPWRQHLLCLAAGCLQGGASLLWIHAMSTAELIGEGAFIVSLSVVFVPLLGRIFFGDHISARLLLALPVAIGGLALLSLEHGLSLRPSQWQFLLSSIGFSMHLVVLSHMVQRVPALPMASLQLLTTGLFGLTAALLLEPFNLHVPPFAWVWLLLSSLVAGSLRFALQIRAIRLLKPTQIGMILVLEPVWATLLGVWQLGEHMPLSKIFGCALIFASLMIYRITWPSKKVVPAV